MDFEKLGTSENCSVKNSNQNGQVLDERPFQLLFQDQGIIKDSSRKPTFPIDKTNKENISSPEFGKPKSKPERQSNIFSQNFIRPKLEMLSLHELHPDDNNALITDKSQLVSENQPFRLKSILKLQKFSLRNDAEQEQAIEENPELQPRAADGLPITKVPVDNKIETEHERHLPRCSLIIQDEPEREVKETKSPHKRERVSFNLPSIDIMQQNPSVANIGRESLKLVDSIVMNTQYLYYHHTFMKRLCGLHIIQLIMILAAAICCYLIPGFRIFLNDFPYFVVITGASALLIFLLLITVRKISSKSPFNVILYVLYCLLLAVSLSIIGTINDKNIGLLFASGMALAISLFVGCYATFKQTPMSFVGGMWIGLFSVFLVFGYSLILMETKDHPLIFWVSLAGIGYGIYLAYDLRQISCSKRTIWGPDEYASAAICLHFDWVLIIWDMSKLVAVTYNNSRMSLRRSRASVNLN